MSNAENQTAGRSATDPAPSGMPAETVRAILSLAIFVHLFIATVAGLGALRASSELVGRLNDKFVTQLQFPRWLLLSNFAYHLTYNRDVDYDGSAEIILNWQPEYETQPDRIEAADRIVLFDPEQIKLPIRRQRYLTLVRRMTDVATSQPPSPREIDMPSAVSKAMLSGISPTPQGVHRFRLLRIATPAPSYADEAQTPTMPPAYQGNIAVRADGSFEFVKADRASLVAPPVQGRQSVTPRIPPLDADPSDPSQIPRSPLPLDNPGQSDGNR